MQYCFAFYQGNEKQQSVLWNLKESAAKCVHNFLKQGKHEAIFYFATVAQSER